jgi:hypothetical protein
VFNPEQWMFRVVNGKELFATFTKIFTGTSLLAFLNCFYAPAPWALMVPFFLTY